MHRTARAWISTPILLSALYLSPSPATEAQQRVAVTSEQVATVQQTADAFHDAGLFDGVVLVAQDGEVLFEKAYGHTSLELGVPNTLDTRFRLASVTKQFTATAVMLLAEEGKIDLDSPISTYLPKYREDIADRVTVHQLLTHTSCVPEETAFMLEERTDRVATWEHLFGLINGQGPVMEPGTRFSYNNVGYMLLARIVESVSGVDFAEFLEQRIFGPLGMENTGFALRHQTVDGIAAGYALNLGEVERPARVDASWYRGAGGLYSTAGDLLVWDRALHENALISPAGTERMFSPSEHANYGYGWSLRYYWVEGDRRGIVAHTGGAPGVRTTIDRFPDDGLLIVVLSNVRHSQVAALSRSIGLVLLGAPTPSFPGRYMEDELQRVLFAEGMETASTMWEAAWNDPELWPPRSGTFNRMGYQFLRSGRVDQALQLFRMYVTLFPGVVNAYDSFGEALLVAGMRDSAIAYYRKAVDLDLEKVNALYMLRHLGDPAPGDITDPVLRIALDSGVDTAAERHHEMREEGTAPHEFYINVAGYNLLRHDRPEDALKLFQLNVAVFPESANTWDSLGEAYMTLDRSDEAIQSYRKSLELDPDNGNAARMLERLSGIAER